MSNFSKDVFWSTADAVGLYSPHKGKFQIWYFFLIRLYDLSNKHTLVQWRGVVVFHFLQCRVKDEKHHSLFVYFGIIKTELASKVWGTKLDLINFYKFLKFYYNLQSSVAPPRWIGWILIEYRPETSEKWIPSREVGIDYSEKNLVSASHEIGP